MVLHPADWKMIRKVILQATYSSSNQMRYSSRSARFSLPDLVPALTQPTTSLFDELSIFLVTK